MDAIKNPFSPGAGSPPPELVGRVKEKRPAHGDMEFTVPFFNEFMLRVMPKLN